MRRQARISGGGALIVRSASALQVWLWLLIFIFQNEFRISRSIQPGYLDFDNLPETNFTCAGKVIGGYYADLETSCQMFHVCTVGQQEEPMDIKFLCLNGTVFDQETRVCERVDEVDCTKSEKFYSLNLELYGSTLPPPVIQEDVPKTESTEQSNKKTKPNLGETDPSIDESATTSHSKTHEVSTDVIDSTEDPVQDIKKDEYNNKPQEFSSSHHSLADQDDDGEEYRDEDENVEYEEDYPHSPTTTSFRPADGVYITHAPPQQFDHFQYESSRTAPRPGQPRPAAFVQRPQPQPFRPTTLDPRDQLLRPGPTSQSSERHETSIKHRLPQYPSVLPAQRPLPFNPYYYDRKRSEDSSPEVESSLSARSVPPATVTERPPTKPKSPPRVIVTASASVSDSNGKRLNYTVGNVVSAVKPIVPINYDDYKESDLIFDPFFLDVPKLQKRRKTRSNIRNRRIFTVPATATVSPLHKADKKVKTTISAPTKPQTTPTSYPITTTTVAWNPDDYVDDNYEPHAYAPPDVPPAVIVAHNDFKIQGRPVSHRFEDKITRLKPIPGLLEKAKPTESAPQTISKSSLTSLGGLIENVYRSDSENAVDFGSLHATLLILAKKLDLLDRHVSVNIPHGKNPKPKLENSKITVGEIKVQAKMQKNWKDTNDALDDDVSYSSNKTSVVSSSYRSGVDKREEKNINDDSPIDAPEIETHQEKIFVVDRRVSTTNRHLLDQKPQTLVTREQYTTLEYAVKKLEERFGQNDSKLLKNYHRTSYFSDPMAVIQVSARVEAVEKAIAYTIQALEALPSRGYNNVPSNTANVLSSAYNNPSPITSPATGNKLNPTAVFVSLIGSNFPTPGKTLAMDSGNTSVTGQKTIKMESSIGTVLEGSIKKNVSIILDLNIDLKLFETCDEETISRIYSKGSQTLEKSDIDITQIITMEQLRHKLRGFTDDMTNMIQQKCSYITQTSKSTSEYGILSMTKLTANLKKLHHIDHLRDTVKQYVEKSDKLNTKLTRNATLIDEELSSLQNEVEVATELMKEVVMKPVPENKAVKGLTQNMEELLLDVEYFRQYQDELQELQNQQDGRLKVLGNRIDFIDISKVSRSEINEALSKKVDLRAINKLINSECFYSNLKNLHECIDDLCKHFNHQERAWQKRIHHYFLILEKKVNKDHLNALNDDILNKIDKIDKHLDFMISVCSENREEKTDDKEIIQNEPCISCDRPKGETFKLKSSKKQKQPKNNDKTKICYSNQPIPHPITPGSTCARFCLQSHNTSKDAKNKKELTANIIVTPSRRSDKKLLNEPNTTTNYCEPCDTPEWKKTILKHNQKLLPEILAQNKSLDKSEESLVSLKRITKQNSMAASLKPVNINFSEQGLNDILSHKLSVQDLDEDIILTRISFSKTK
ncbi:chitin binding peritrophin-A domain-containing protein [Phthorimaea operculella]|nr:chitin binding peritrophin-A domain-containing protein [Phthorimaea operculella]